MNSYDSKKKKKKLYVSFSKKKKKKLYSMKLPQKI